jgi:hypothetical protein
VASRTRIYHEPCAGKGDSSPTSVKSPRLAAQQIPLTDKITRLDGTWARVPEKGWGGICGVPASNGMRLSVSPTEISIEADTFS